MNGKISVGGNFITEKTDFFKYSKSLFFLCLWIETLLLIRNYPLNQILNCPLLQFLLESLQFLVSIQRLL